MKKCILLDSFIQLERVLFFYISRPIKTGKVAYDGKKNVKLGEKFMKYVKTVL